MPMQNTQLKERRKRETSLEELKTLYWDLLIFNGVGTFEIFVSITRHFSECQHIQRYVQVYKKDVRVVLSITAWSEKLDIRVRILVKLVKCSLCKNPSISS